MIALHDRIRVHVRDEWVAVEVTRLPDDECASWAGHSDDGRLVTWDASHEVEAVQERGWLERSLASASAEVAKWTREKQEAMRVHPGGGCLEDTLARLEGALAGWRVRALLAEDLIGNAVPIEEHDAVLAQLAGARHDRDAALATVKRLRDRIAIAEHQHELARDVLRAVDGWADPGDSGTDTLMRAWRAWVAAGRPGLGGER